MRAQGGRRGVGSGAAPSPPCQQCVHRPLVSLWGQRGPGAGSEGPLCLHVRAGGAGAAGGGSRGLRERQTCVH
eukprot:3657506-Pyramimonas_sp.AAC.2